MHFEYIAGSACQAIANAAGATGVPMALGVLTTLTEEQAMEFAGLRSELRQVLRRDTEAGPAPKDPKEAPDEA